jgi:hypothetical protein
MRNRRIIMLAATIGAAVVVYETLVGPRALAQSVGTNIDAPTAAANGQLTGACDGTITVIAVTNMVPTTIRNPRNTGDCTIVLECLNAMGMAFGMSVAIQKGGGLQSFSCPATAVNITAMPIIAANMSYKLVFVP